MTPGEHARDMVLRLAAIDPTDGDGITDIVTKTIVAIVKDERARCAEIAHRKAKGLMNGNYILDSLAIFD